MGGGDRPDDRQAQPGAAAGAPSSARVKRSKARPEPVGEARRPGRRPRSTAPSPSRAAASLHLAAAVTEGVVDQVPERLLDPQRVELDLRRPPVPRP